MLSAQAPTAPVISARGTVALGGLVQITGLNLGPPEGATASAIPWPAKLADVQVVLGGKPAHLAEQRPGPPHRQRNRSRGPHRQRYGLRRALAHATSQTIATTADGLGPTDVSIAAGDVGPSGTPATPKAAIGAYIGGLRAPVSAAASTQRPGEFDVSIAKPPT